MNFELLKKDAAGHPVAKARSGGESCILQVSVMARMPGRATRRTPSHCNTCRTNSGLHTRAMRNVRQSPTNCTNHTRIKPHLAGVEEQSKLQQGRERELLTFS